MQLCFANRDEKSATLAGDTVIENPFLCSTHAITIAKEPAQVWPWLIQMGQDRGGFYSYTLLENLLGCRMKNANAIHPEWQQLEAGDAIQIHPRFHPLLVKEIETPRSLLLWQQAPVFWTWSFNLVNHEAETRLIVRSRVAKAGLIKSLALTPIMTLGHYFMERKMLSGIKTRSENNP